MKNKPRKLMLVRYINAQCYVNYFNSLKHAKRWVYQHEGISQPYSSGIAKRIGVKINKALKYKEMYCGGQWIELPKE